MDGSRRTPVWLSRVPRAADKAALVVYGVQHTQMSLDKAFPQSRSEPPSSDHCTTIQGVEDDDVECAMVQASQVPLSAVPEVFSTVYCVSTLFCSGFAPTDGTRTVGSLQPAGLTARRRKVRQMVYWRTSASIRTTSALAGASWNCHRRKGVEGGLVNDPYSEE